MYGKGIDEILLRIAIGSDGQSYAYYPQQNHEGSVTLLSDSSGNVLERYRYDAFGAPTIYDGSWNGRSNTMYDNRFLFTGREYAATYRSIYNTPAFNFYEYRARAYNPTLGRFMSEDPKLFDAGDYNLFRYCHNDPIDNVDPMGLYDTNTLDFVRQEAQSLHQGMVERFQSLLKTINNKQSTIAEVKRAANRAVSDFRQGSEYGPRDRINFKAPRGDEKGFMRLPDAQRKALIAAGVVGGYYTSGTAEGAVGVTYNPTNMQWGLTRTYALGHATIGDAGEVGLPKLVSGDYPFFGSKGHGHSGMKPISGSDRFSANVSKNPNAVNINGTIHIYVPRVDAPEDSGMHGVIENY